MKKKVTVIGAGMFGYAMANYLAEQRNEVKLYDSNQELTEYLIKERRHPIHFQDMLLEKNIQPFSGLEEAVNESEVIITSVPAQKLRYAARSMKGMISDEAVLLNLAKGLEVGSNSRPSQILEEEIGKHRIATLSGGMFAEDLIRKKPLFGAVASKRYKTAKEMRDFLASERFYPSASKDIIGVEFAGPLKNVIAITSGIGFGMGYSHSTMSGFIAAFSREAEELAVKLKAKRKTFSVSSQAWGADIMTTCFGNSRNREFGILVGQGNSAQEALNYMEKANKLVEGYHTTRVLYELSKIKRMNVPIISATYGILYNGISAKDAINYLMKSAGTK